MTPDQIRQWAIQVGAVVETGMAPVFYTHKQLQAFAIVVRNESLEDAAEQCEKLPYKNSGVFAEIVRLEKV